MVVAGAAQAQAEDKNAEFTPLAFFSFFVNRCRENLHVVIAFSPIGEAFRNRIRQFPSLINCCNIDWFQLSIHNFYFFFAFAQHINNNCWN